MNESKKQISGYNGELLDENYRNEVWKNVIKNLEKSGENIEELLEKAGKNLKYFLDNPSDDWGEDLEDF